MEIDKIYNEDCLVGMKAIPDKSIDLIIADLPYQTTDNSPLLTSRNYGHNTRG